MELIIKSVLCDDCARGIWYIFEFLHVETTLSKIDTKNLFTFIHPLIDVFVT